MNASSPLLGARESVTDGLIAQSASNLVIDSLDEFAVGNFACVGCTSDYAIGSL